MNNNDVPPGYMCVLAFDRIISLRWED